MLNVGNVSHRPTQKDTDKKGVRRFAEREKKTAIMSKGHLTINGHQTNRYCLNVSHRTTQWEKWGQSLNSELRIGFLPVLLYVKQGEETKSAFDF